MATPLKWIIIVLQFPPTSSKGITLNIAEEVTDMDTPSGSSNSVFGLISGQVNELLLNPAGKSNTYTIGSRNRVITKSDNTKDFEIDIGGLSSEVIHAGSGSAEELWGGNIGTFSIGIGRVDYQKGLNVLSTNSGGGSTRDNYGFKIVTGHAGNSYGINSSINNGSITSDYTMYIHSPFHARPLINHYGIYLEDQDFGTKNSYAIYSAGGKSYFAGNVGIGTKNPNAQLHLVNTGSNNLNPYLLMESSLANGGPGIQAKNDLGNLIGLTMFGSAINNSRGFIDPTDSGVLVSTGAGGLRIQTLHPSAPMLFVTGGSGLPSDERMRITAGGKVGIGTTDPNFKLEVAGSAGKPGGGSWSDSSDIRLKKNVKPIDNALGKILSIQGVTYQWKNSSIHNNMNATYMGMIANEVEKVFPEWVGIDKDGYKTLGFIGFEALAVESIRDLKAQNDELQDEFNELKSQNERLQQRLDMLESKNKYSNSRK